MKKILIAGLVAATMFVTACATGKTVVHEATFKETQAQLVTSKTYVDRYDDDKFLRTEIYFNSDYTKAVIELPDGSFEKWCRTEETWVQC